MTAHAPIHYHKKLGESNGAAKLTEDEVLEIVAREDEKSRELAEEYGVSTSLIRQIWSGHAWAWLTGRGDGRRRQLFRGDPVRSASMWVVIRRFDNQRGAYWEPQPGTVAGTRTAAIRKYDEFWERIPDAYRKARRRGEVLAVHCHVEPVTFEGGGS